MSNKKTVIHEFDPCIYPRLLWVVKGGELEEIRKTLEFADIEDDFYNSGGAITISAYDNQKKKGGFLVWFPKSGEMSNLDWIAHESAHVALGIFDYIGSEVAANESEPFAYLVGWVFKCIDKVKKFKDIKDGCNKGKPEHSQDGQLETPCEETQEARRNG